MSTGVPAGTCVGPYEVRDLLGAGALGVVYRAHQASLERDVALKLLAPGLASDEDLVERFRREAKTAASLRHPHIVTIFDTGSASGYHYIAMDLLPGVTLNRLALPLPWRQAADLARQLCDALSYAHSHGVVHRDLKPENALADESGRVVLTDFGIARVIGQVSLTLGDMPIGTPEFMSPEQALGKPADARSDIYALGLLLWVLLSGESPFLAATAMATMYRQVHEPLPALPDSIPLPLRSWIERCASKAAGDRYESGADALKALQAAIDRSPHEVTPERTLNAVLRGELSLSAALAANREQEAEIRAAFQREVTAMSLDIVRSTLLKAPGQTIMASFTFGAFRKQVQAVVDEHGCRASVWSGDGLMALFPSADEAAVAAREIVQGLEGFNSSRSGLQDPVQVRIGLHSGRVMMADGERLGEVTSPTLDIAGRLQKTAMADTVLMSEAAWSQLLEREGWTDGPGVEGIQGPVYRFGDSGIFAQSSEAGASRVAASTNASTLVGSSLTPPAPVATETMVRLAAVREDAAALVGPVSGGAAAARRVKKLAQAPAVSFQIGIPRVSFEWKSFVQWGLITTLCLFVSGAVAGNPVTWVLWLGLTIAVTASRRRGSDAWPWQLGGVLFLFILIVMISRFRSGEPLPIELFVGPLSLLGIGGLTLFNVADEARLRGQRRYVVLQKGEDYAALPRFAVGHILSILGQNVRRLGYGERQLGVRLKAIPAGPQVMIRAEVFDRGTNQMLAEAAVGGEAGDVAGLADDTGRRLAAELEQKQLAARDRSSLPGPGVGPPNHDTLIREPGSEGG